jgi:hypothetical protein
MQESYLSRCHTPPLALWDQIIHGTRVVLINSNVINLASWPQPKTSHPSCPDTGSVVTTITCVIYVHGGLIIRLHHQVSTQL